VSNQNPVAFPSSSAAVAVLDAANGPIDPPLVNWLEEQFTTLRSLLARTARDLVTIGGVLGQVKAELAQDEFVAFVEVLGLSRATAYRWMAAAAAAAGCSHIENVEPSALYALAAKSTPDEVRESFLRHADAGHRVTLQDVQATLRQHRPARPQSAPSLVERIVDGMVEAEEARAGRDWRGQNVRASEIQREIARFEEESRSDVAATVLAWGHACVEAAQPFMLDEDGQ
jgi:hypothetical protein